MMTKILQVYEESADERNGKLLRYAHRIDGEGERYYIKMGTTLFMVNVAKGEQMRVEEWDLGGLSILV